MQLSTRPKATRTARGAQYTPPSLHLELEERIRGCARRRSKETLRRKKEAVSNVFNSSPKNRQHSIPSSPTSNSNMNQRFPSPIYAPDSPRTPPPAETRRKLLHVISETLIKLEENDQHYFAYGEVSQIWKRQLGSTGQIVAVKGFRMTQGKTELNSNFEKKLDKLVGQWRKLNHPNIMPCLGLTMDIGLIASLVLPLCPDGSINEYVKNHPSVHKLSLLSQVATGIAYLHSQGVVHGKIRGKNILISSQGRPIITDTGLSQVIRSEEGLFPWALPSDSLRWMAPEVFDPEISDPCTKSSDVWSLAMTILEVMSGEMPYHPRRMIHPTAIAIMEGVLPQRPENGSISDELWGVLRMLWQQNPEERPCAAFVEWQLEALRTNNLYCLYKL